MDQILYVFRPVTSGYYFYDALAIDPDEMNGISFPISDTCAGFASPISFEEVFDFGVIRAPTMRFFRPIAPTGFYALGCVAAISKDQIPGNILCVPAEKVVESQSVQIQCFNPFGPPIQLIRNSSYAFDTEKAKVVVQKEPLGLNKNFLMPLDVAYSDGMIQDSDWIKNEALPLFDPQLEEKLMEQPEMDDPARNALICQQPVQLGAVLADTTHIFVLNPENDSDFMQLAAGFQLVGVTSSEVQEEGKEERYIYIYQPIAPPGYVAMGVTVSSGDVDREVYCINEKYVFYTSDARTIGKVYDQQTAAYMHDAAQLCDIEAVERKRRLKELDQPKMNLVEVVIPKQSQFFTVKEKSYPVIKPEFQAMLWSQEFCSQKSIVKSMKQETDNQLLCEVLVYDQVLQIFQQALKKDTFNVYLHYCRSKQQTGNELAAEIQALTAQQKQAEPQQVQQVQKGKGKTDVVEKVDTVKEDVLPPVPAEYQIVENGHGIELFATALPIGFDVLFTISSTSCQVVNFIRLRAADGYEALSDVVHVGDISTFQLHKFCTVQKTFLQELSLIPRHQLAPALSVFAFALPLGPDAQSTSQYTPLFIRDHSDYVQFKCFQMKDQVVQSFLQQDSKMLKFTQAAAFTPKALELTARLVNLLETAPIEVQINSMLKSVTSKDYCTFGSNLVEKQLDISEDMTDTSRFFQKMLACDPFKTPFTPNALFAHPKGFEKIAGSINDLKCYHMIPPAGYVALGDVLSEKEPDVSQYVCLHTSLVETKVIKKPDYLLTGFVDTNGVYVYQDVRMNLHCLCFDQFQEQVTVYYPKKSFMAMLECQTERGYFPQSEQVCFVDPRFMLQYVQNYCANNKTGLHQQKLYDYQMYQFDATMVLDPVFVNKGQFIASLSQFRAFSTYQYINQDMIKQYLQTGSKNSPPRKDAAPVNVEAIDMRLKQIESIIEVFVNLGYGVDMIQYGKQQCYSLKVFQQTPIPQSNYVIISDKLPIGPDGPLLAHRPIYFNLILKAVAKIVGGYKQLLEMESRKALEFFGAIFGFRIGGPKEVFKLYILDNGEISTVGEEKQAVVFGI